MITDHIQHADWTKEKHVPLIECPDTVPVNELFEVKVSLGKEIAHPNTTDHHIRWIRIYFKPRDGKFIHDVAAFEFNSHGESVDGPDQGPVYTHHAGVTWLKIMEPGTIFALAYCNIHGLWESTRDVHVQ